MVLWACDLTQSRPTVDALSAAVATSHDACVPYYAMNALDTILNDTMANYTATNTDYDKYFGYYQEYVRDMVPNPAVSLYRQPARWRHVLPHDIHA